jgi:hypothetical protein
MVAVNAAAILLSSILALSKKILDATLIGWNSKKKKLPCLQRLPQK